MATFYELPLANDFPYFVVNSSGASVPASGYKLFLYSTGSSSKITTYTDSTGGTPNANPVLLGSTGLPQSGANVVGIWLAQGQTVKAVFAPSTDTDPPSSPIWTRDFGANPPGINDPTENVLVNSEWVLAGTPTFVSTTSFSLTGDQTAIFNKPRRIKSTNSGGTIYSQVISSAFASVTTVTVKNDSGVLDSGLTAVSYALLSGTNPSVPPFATTPLAVDSSDASKRVKFGVSQVPTATDVTLTVPALSGTVAVNVNGVCNGRLTLTTGVPVTNADVTAATTIYFSPYAGNAIALYNGTIWSIFGFSETSIAVPATTSQMYDIFAFNNSGTVNIEALAWTSDTARATALVLQNGVLMKTGDLTRRYVGSFRTTGVSGQTEDSSANRFVWNYYNRVQRNLKVVDTTNTWTYTTATYRQANGAATNQFSLIVGYQETMLQARVDSSATNPNGAGANFAVGIGIDSTSSNSAQVMNFGSSFTVAASSGTINGQVSAQYRGYPAVGKHDIVWLEISAAAGTTTWYGDNGLAYVQSGMQADYLA
jgi:hypothetical protein